MSSFLLLILLLSLTASGSSNRLIGLPTELINFIASYSSNDDFRTLSQVPGIRGDVVIANQYMKKIHDACSSDNVKIKDYYDVCIADRLSRKCVSTISANRLLVRKLSGIFNAPLASKRMVSDLRTLSFTKLKFIIRGRDLISANLTTFVEDAIFFPKNRLFSLFIEFESLEDDASAERALTLIKMLGSAENNRIRKFSLRSVRNLSGRLIGESIAKMKHLDDLAVYIAWDRQNTERENFIKSVWGIVPRLKKWNDPFGFSPQILSMMPFRNDSYALEKVSLTLGSSFVLSSVSWNKTFSNLCHLLKNSRKLKTFQISVRFRTSMFSVREARTIGSILATLPAIEDISFRLWSSSRDDASMRGIELMNYVFLNETRDILPRLKRLESFGANSLDIAIKNQFFKSVEVINLEDMDLEFRADKSISSSLSQYTELIKKCEHLKSIYFKWPIHLSAGLNPPVLKILSLAEAIGSRSELKHVTINLMGNRNFVVNIMGQSIMQRMWPSFCKLWSWLEDFMDPGRLRPRHGLFWSAMRMLKTSDRPASYSFRRIQLSLPRFYVEPLDKKALRNFYHLLKNSPDLQEVIISTVYSKRFEGYLEEIAKYLPLNIRLKIHYPK